MSCHTVEFIVIGLQISGKEVALLFLILIAQFGCRIRVLIFFFLQVWTKMMCEEGEHKGGVNLIEC